jgi:heavy metal translocating P-type ATPase
MKESPRKKSNLGDILVLSLVPVTVLFLIIIAWLVLKFTSLNLLSDIIAILAIALGGWLRFRQAIKDIARRKITVNVFVAVAILASLLIGQFISAAIIVFIMAVAGSLESFTVKKTRHAIEELLDFTPKTARILREGKLVEMPLEQVNKGEIVVVITSERIPVDGHIIEGTAAINQAPITGESMPIDKVTGDIVFAGTLNEAGNIRIEVDKVGADTTLARIIHLVEEAQERKAPIALIADRFTAYFLPAVSLIAVLTYVITGEITRAVAVLLVACPCALAIATPSAVTAGIANLARRGVLIKGGMFFEVAGKIKTVVLDKTGTTTIGKPKVHSIVTFDTIEEDELIRLAASVETFSEHPIASAILEKAKEMEIVPVHPQEHRVIPGRGVSGVVEGKPVTVSNLRHLEKTTFELTPEIKQEIEKMESQGFTSLIVSTDSKALGIIGVGDQVRNGVHEATSWLRKIGVGKLLLFTGDNKRVAQQIGKEIGVDEIRSELLPEDKLIQLRSLRENGEIVAMIGDGINDAPALAEADVGVAMGTAGTDLAMEAADICLMRDELVRVADTIRFSRGVSRRIKINILLSMIYNAVGITLSSLGILNPIPAVLYQELGCLSVIMSSTLLLFSNPESYRL